jgi:DNA (cytosine-5)-methyltransferase 1
MKNNNDKIKFIDLFAGIGGFRVGLESAGFECVFSAEIDDHACEMYKENFGDNPKCDITKLDPKIIPDFDILCAGFPCQAFSISGKQKGFYDNTRGTLFFEICRILDQKKPKVFILENVQNLEKHDRGNTLRVMIYSLEKLGYTVSYKVLNAKDFGVPQNRERIVIVGNREGRVFNFELLKKSPAKAIKYYLDKEGDFEFLNPSEYTLIDNYKQQPKSGLIFIGYRNKKIRTVGVRPNTEHLSRVHKQPNRIYSAEGIHPTIASQETSGRYWILTNDRVRKLTLDECFRFMGFPKNFKKVGLKSKLYERIGNSICVKMVEAVAKEVYSQFFSGGNNMYNEDNPIQFLENIYGEANRLQQITDVGLNQQQLNWVNTLVMYEETFKGVYSVLVSSLTYKCLYPEQDVRNHKIELDNGYSGRSFDTKYVTPFLKSKQFYGAMKESGWLTRSLEQPHPFDLDFPGKIRNSSVKEAFLQILNDVEVNSANPREFLLAIIKESLIEKSKRAVELINPIDTESDINISQIIDYLHRHFYYKYSSRGASILPVIALYSIYQCITKELKRFDGKYLETLNSHTSCDRSSGATGDIVVRNTDDNEIYEVVEVKFDIPANKIMVQDAYKKLKTTQTQRYYILSTVPPLNEEIAGIREVIQEVREEHGCQIIVNGVFETLKYYLRLIENTDDFMNYYLENLQNDHEINFEHKIAWNRIINRE